MPASWLDLGQVADCLGHSETVSPATPKPATSRATQRAQPREGRLGAAAQSEAAHTSPGGFSRWVWVGAEPLSCSQLPGDARSSPLPAGLCSVPGCVQPVLSWALPGLWPPKGTASCPVGHAVGAGTGPPPPRGGAVTTSAPRQGYALIC